MNQKKIKEEFNEKMHGVNYVDEVLREINDNYFIIPNRLLPKVDYGWIGEPCEVVDGYDLASFKHSQEMSDEFFRQGTRSLVISDLIESKVDLKISEEERTALWEALVSISPELSSLGVPEYFQGIDDVPTILREAVVKIAELNRELTKTRRNNTPKPPNF